MNIGKIESLLEKTSILIREDVLTDEEYLIFVANLLISFGYHGIKVDENLSGLNLDDGNALELALLQDPNNPYLASLLQGHVLIGWSRNV